MAEFNTIQWNGNAYSASTCNGVIYRAFRIAQLLKNAEQIPSTEWVNDAFSILNVMIDSMNAVAGMHYGIKRNVYPLTQDIQDYTIGPGGDFEHATVDEIIRAGVVYQNIEYPLGVMGVYNRADWTYTQTSSLPSSVYLERGTPSPTLGTLSYLYKPYVPMDTTLYLREPISGFQSLDDEVLLRPGYLQYLQYNLAEELALSWPQSNMQPKAHQIAARSKQALLAINSHPNMMACSPDFTQGSGPRLAGATRQIRITGYAG